MGHQTLLLRGADKSLARSTPRNILFDGENISFDASLVIYIYINSTNIIIITIIIIIYGQSLWLQIQRSRVRSPALPDFLSSSGSGTGSTQPREVN
jgi:hypothetical protein